MLGQIKAKHGGKYFQMCKNTKKKKNVTSHAPFLRAIVKDMIQGNGRLSQDKKQGHSEKSEEESKGCG